MKAINKLKFNNVVLDGEIVVVDDNQKSNFQLLQNAIKEQTGEFIYYVFDVLYYDKASLLQLPLLERKAILKKIISKSNSTILRYSEHIEGEGTTVLSKACELDLEGIISKDATSTYQQKRSTAWLKSKCTKRQEFIIRGYTKPKNSRTHFGRALTGYL